MRNPRFSSLRVIKRALQLSLIFTLAFNLHLKAQPDGKALFKTNCASCHHPTKDGTGPALAGVDGRVPSKEWLYSWVKNSAAVISSGDKYANDLFSKWNKTAMTPFPGLSNEEIDAIVAYVNTPVEQPAEGATGAAEKKGAEGGNTTLYAILTIILLIVAVILSQVNKILGKNANAKLGLPVKKDIPWYRNKAWIAAFSVIGFILIGYFASQGGIGLNRQQNYMPRQPIFYSHKVHAGVNQINCRYCHTGAEKSRHAMIPSTNVCMNCHKQINEYTGAEAHPLVSLEGNEIDGTSQIQELYKYTGWDPLTKKYKTDEQGSVLAKSIPWVKVHNLPDHVYFNHQLHVVSGKIDCQRCHGNIEEMDEVYQKEPLSMGWCINCHRETNVQFESNDYYSIFEKYHKEIKEGKRTEVKVSEIGGLECQKCHY